MTRILAALFAAAAVFHPLSTHAQTLTPEEAELKAHVAFLASDAMKGRDTGSPELAIAEQYVAAQMLAAGLEPGGEHGSWFQPVPLVSYKAADHGTVTLTGKAGTTGLEWGTDFYTRPDPRQPETILDGAVVFAGYGVTDPATGYDDYKGLDVRGKIVAVIRDAPRSLNSEVRAHLGRPDEQAANAQRHGAAGVILIEGATRRATFPFARYRDYWNYAAMTWADASGTPSASGVPAPAYLSQEGAAKLFAGSKLDWGKTLAADAAGKKLKTGALGITARIVARSTIERVSANNVVGVLEGSDPTLKGEYVVLSAHLDHVGVGKPDDTGDTIYNGAMDNAVGTAAMLEVARRFQRAGEKPRRSILFVAVTAEEKGLVGSDYFAQHPTVRRESMVADINLDMPILTYAFEDLVAYGADRSGVGPAVAAAAKAEGVTLSPDPHPEQVIFVRSDHYSFVKAGVPAVSLDLGPKGPGAAAGAEFEAKHYHQPSDEIRLIDWAQGVRFVSLNYRIARTIADADQRPLWNKGDFFGTLYNGPMAH